MLMCGACHYGYNQVSFAVLSAVTPLTHAVCNVMRRIFVILATTLYFGRVLGPKTILGMAAVFTGVAWYLSAQARAVEARKKH